MSIKIYSMSSILVSLVLAGTFFALTLTINNYSNPVFLIMKNNLKAILSFKTFSNYLQYIKILNIIKKADER